MKMLRRRLVWKLFLSYLVIITVGVTVLALTATLNAPTALDRHMADMQSMMGDLRDNFVAAIDEVLAVAVVAATLAAVALSVFTARRIMGPLRAMTDAPAAASPAATTTSASTCPRG